MMSEIVSFSLDEQWNLTPGRDSGCVWIQSDLQLNHPAQAQVALSRAVEDVATMTLQPAAIWCLGDALTGANASDLEKITRTCIEQLESLGVPICYVLGNHEMDFRRTHGRNKYPLYEQAVHRPLWHTSEKISDPWFVRSCLGCDVVFFGDHADSDAMWYTSHHRVEAGDAHYPHGEDTWYTLREAFAKTTRPLMTAGHYAYPGGQRPGSLMSKLFPLPRQVRSHVYGHAHIGDMVHNGERPWQRENPVEGHDLIQYNISALEDKRSPGSHSAMLHFADGQPIRLDIRCHLEQRWVEHFDLK